MSSAYIYCKTNLCIIRVQFGIYACLSFKYLLDRNAANRLISLLSVLAWIRHRAGRISELNQLAARQN
jgi:hypothetical protein